MSSMRCLISGLPAISASCRYWAAICRKKSLRSAIGLPIRGGVRVAPVLTTHLRGRPSRAPPPLTNCQGRSSLRHVVARRGRGCPARVLLGHDAIATGQQCLQQGLGAFLAELFIEGRSALEHVSGRQAQFGELADIHGYFWESAA